MKFFSILVLATFAFNLNTFAQRKSDLLAPQYNIQPIDNTKLLYQSGKSLRNAKILGIVGAGLVVANLVIPQKGNPVSGPAFAAGLGLCLGSITLTLVHVPKVKLFFRKKPTLNFKEKFDAVKLPN